jgi:hypothetical protein
MHAPIQYTAPLRFGAERTAFVERHVRNGRPRPTSILTRGRVVSWHAALEQAFGTEEAIVRLGAEEIFDALCHLNSFLERRRFFSG